MHSQLLVVKSPANVLMKIVWRAGDGIDPGRCVCGGRGRLHTVRGMAQQQHEEARPTADGGDIGKARFSNFAFVRFCR